MPTEIFLAVLAALGGAAGYVGWFLKRRIEEVEKQRTLRWRKTNG
jgi:hypothetical protein